MPRVARGQRGAGSKHDPGDLGIAQFPGTAVLLSNRHELGCVPRGVYGVKRGDPTFYFFCQTALRTIPSAQSVSFLQRVCL